MRTEATRERFDFSTEANSTLLWEGEKTLTHGSPQRTKEVAISAHQFTFIELNYSIKITQNWTESRLYLLQYGWCQSFVILIPERK